jgi:hypothetical protein
MAGATARAQADEPGAADRSLAQSLFDEGRRLMDAGHFDEACPRFADSQRLDPGGGTVLNLALCYEKLGKLALAYSTYNEALSLAISEHRREREDFARQRIGALETRLPRLRLRVTDPPADLTIDLDGRPVPASAWGMATPVDPGRHTVDASAPGFPPFQAIMTFAEGETRALDVSMPASGQARGAASPPTGEAHVWRSIEKRRTPAFYVVGGLGLAAGATSLVTGVIALSAHMSVQQECNTGRDYCPPNGQDDATRARTMAWVSTGTLAGAALATVVALLLPLSEREVTRVSLGGGGISIALVR